MSVSLSASIATNADDELDALGRVRGLCRLLRDIDLGRVRGRHRALERRSCAAHEPFHYLDGGGPYILESRITGKPLEPQSHRTTEPVEEVGAEDLGEPKAREDERELPRT